VTKRIISISGTIGAGKDSIADFLITHHGFKRVSFAGALKDAVAAVFGWDRELVDGVSKASREWREEVDVWWSNRLEMPNLTPRFVLQYMGTEVFRNHFHSDIWVASVEHKLLTSKDDVVITDARFANEVDAVKRSGGLAIRVVRGESPEWYQAALDYNRGPRGNTNYLLSKSKLERFSVHPSEYSHIGLDFDAVIENNSTIDSLHDRISQLIKD
jgi:hypothetical protein